jgi:hypothetical protein
LDPSVTFRYLSLWFFVLVGVVILTNKHVMQATRRRAFSLGSLRRSRTIYYPEAIPVYPTSVMLCLAPSNTTYLFNLSSSSLAHWGEPFGYLLLILVPDGEADLDLSISDFLPSCADRPPVF